MTLRNTSNQYSCRRKGKLRVTVRYHQLDMLALQHLPDINLTCPSEFANGINILVCQINRTAIREAGCVTQENEVTFAKTANSGVPSIIHQITTFDSSSCFSVLNPSANSCWCDKSDGEIFFYKLTFFAISTQDEGAHLECRTCFMPGRPLKVTSSESCKKLKFGVQSGASADVSRYFFVLRLLMFQVLLRCHW